jgi:hypothetical protein
MKRTEIIKQLIAEGFTEKTLVNFSDRQLQSLSTRINESLTVNADTLQKDPSTKTKVDAISKTENVEIVPEDVEESGVPGLKAKVVKETGVPGLKAKVVKETGVPGLKAKVVKETGVPGLKAKVVKETGVPGLKAKEVKESGVPGLKAKVVKETGVPGLNVKKTDVKESGAMPGLTLKGKSTSEPTKKVTKETDVTEKSDNTETNGDEHLTKKELFLKKIGKLKKEKNTEEKETIKEWVDSIADKYYHPFTSKNDIMEMIATKMKQVQTGEKLPKFLSYKGITGSVETAPAEPKTRPTTKPGTTPKTPPAPRKTPYRPGPGINPHPKALSENEPLEVEEGKVPVSNPGKETKPSFNPGKRVELKPKN